jgi:hypothetical protein
MSMATEATTSVGVVQAPHDRQGTAGDDPRSNTPPKETKQGEVSRNRIGGGGAPTASAGESESDAAPAAVSEVRLLDQIVGLLSGDTWVPKTRDQAMPAPEGGRFELYEAARDSGSMSQVIYHADQILEGAVMTLIGIDPAGADLIREARLAIQEHRLADAELLVRSMLEAY